MVPFRGVDFYIMSIVSVPLEEASNQGRLIDYWHASFALNKGQNEKRK